MFIVSAHLLTLGSRAPFAVMEQFQMNDDSDDNLSEGNDDFFPPMTCRLEEWEQWVTDEGHEWWFHPPTDDWHWGRTRPISAWHAAERTEEQWTAYKFEGHEWWWHEPTQRMHWGRTRPNASASTAASSHEAAVPRATQTEAPTTREFATQTEAPTARELPTQTPPIPEFVLEEPQPPPPPAGPPPGWRPPPLP